jgi:agmatinase
VPEPKDVVPFAGCFADTDEARARARLVFVGLPDDSQSTYRRGCARAPERIRLAYDGHCYNATTETGVDLTAAVNDLGDLAPLDSWEATARRYREFAATLYAGGKIPFFAGGDHAVTVPVVAALEALNEPVHVVQIDAHPDLYPIFEGNAYSHACAAARMLELSHVASLTQLGVRTLNRPQSQQAVLHRDRLRILSARDLASGIPALSHIPRGAKVYVNIDIDAFDPAYAPGVSHPVPGGLAPRQVFDFLQCADWTLVGMDVVEVNLTFDRNDQTAVLAARLLHEGMGYAA